MRKTLCLLIGVSLVSLAGCDVGPGLVNPDQPKDLGAPWVNKTDSQFGSSMTSSDDAGNRVFSVTNNDFVGLIEDIAAEYNSPIALKPKQMGDWNLTVEVKGKTLEAVLQDLATKCRLSLVKSSGGVPMLTFPADASGEEHLVKPDDVGGDGDDE